MKFHLTALGRETWNAQALSHWQGLVADDLVGRHLNCDDPSAADRIVFVDLHQHPDDPFMAKLRAHDLVKAFPAKCLVYDQRDRPVPTLPGVYVSAKAGRRHNPRIAGGPYPLLQTDVQPSDLEPDLLWSFAGARTHPVRDIVLSLRDEQSVVLDTSGLPMFSAELEDQEIVDSARRDYRILLGRSRFVLCPRGHGPSSFRLFETLSAGRVPVVISDRWEAPPRINWDICTIRVAERDVADIPRILAVRASEWEQLAESARAVWANNFAAGHLWDHIAQSMATLSVRRRVTPWWMDPTAGRLFAARFRI